MKKVCCLLFALGVTSFASASSLSGTDGFGTPPLPNATSVVDFETQPNATFSSLSLGGVTFSGIGGNLRTDGTYAGQYNGRGTRYLDNNQGLTSSIRFDFATPINGFAFNWGASDVSWNLTAYDASSNMIETFLLPITRGSNAGDYVGLQDSGISFATLIATQPNDYIFVDNFTIAQGEASVPEPAPLALLGLGLVGFIAARRKSAK